MSNTKVETWKISDLISSMGENPIDKNKVTVPKYQRTLVWSQEQKQMLIDSIKDGLPFGAILLYKKGAVDGGFTEYQLIDGLQRSTTIKQYQENPTQFFSKENLSDTKVQNLKDFLIKKVKGLPEQFNLLDEIVEWVKTLNGFEETDKFSSSELAQFIDKRTGDSLSKSEFNELTKLLVSLISDIKNDSNISEAEIPVLVYSGPIENLPKIFERLNSKGTQLTKYQVFAATWSQYDSFSIENTHIIEHIKKKYDALISEGLVIDNYDEDSFFTSEFNYFELLFGLGKLLSGEFPSLLGSNKKDSETDSIGFVLTSLCLRQDLKKMGTLPSKLQKIDVNSLVNSLQSAVKETYEILKPYIEVKANKRANSKNPIVHSELQIASIIARVFVSKFTIDNCEFHENQNWKKERELLKNNIPFRYLYDILRSFWSGTGDSKAFDLSSPDSDKYLRPIDKSSWEFILTERHKADLEKQEKSRVNISNEIILFFKYIYAHTLTVHEEYSNENFHVEHLMPVNRLKKIAAESNEGMPISAFANLCLIQEKINKEKQDLTFKEYYDRKLESGEMTEEQVRGKLEEIERYTFIPSSSLEIIDQISEADHAPYVAFLNKRYKLILEKFFEVNGIS